MANSSELKKLSKNNDKQQFELLTVIDHAVGNTMSTVVPALNCSLRANVLPADIFELVYHAELSARELQGKISALATLFEKPDACNNLRLSSYNIEQFFTAICEQLNQTLGDMFRGRITFRITDNYAQNALFDARRISMILYHLVSNSIQHGKTNNKNIKITCKSKPDYFELIVRDFGGGIPEEVLPNLFNRYEDKFSLDGQFIGLLPPRLTGLGLPLCNKLAKDMNGKIIFKNFDTGAKFTVVIPQERNRLRENVLFVPDDSLMRECMATLLLKLNEGKENL